MCACEPSAGTKDLMKQFKERTKGLFWLTVLGATCLHSRESTAEEQEAGWSHCSCGQGTEMINACVQISFPVTFSLEALLMGWYHLQIRWLFLPHLIPHRQVLINMLTGCFQGALGYQGYHWAITHHRETRGLSLKQAWEIQEVPDWLRLHGKTLSQK